MTKVFETKQVSKSYCYPCAFDTFFNKLAQLSQATLFDLERFELQALISQKIKKAAKKKTAKNNSNLRYCYTLSPKKYIKKTVSKLDHSTRIDSLAFSRCRNGILIDELVAFGYAEYHPKARIESNILIDGRFHTETIFATNSKQLEVDREKLKSKASAKYFTNSYVKHLATLDSILKPSYLSTLECASNISQNGYKLTTKYCKQRWCNVCNRIRTAKLMNGYLPQLNTFTDSSFVTLTVKNMSAKDLPNALNEMNNIYRFIYKKIHKDLGVGKANKSGQEHFLKGLKKIECTYNFKADEYHPHYHLVLANEQVANMFYDYWFCYINQTQNLSCNDLALDVRPITDKKGGAKELFKYFTKVFSKTNEFEYITRRVENSIYTVREKREKQMLVVPAMDTIFNAMRNKRVFEPIGIKAISEDINEIIAEKYSHLQYETKSWLWDGIDWRCDGEGLTDYEPSNEFNQMLQNVIF